MPHRGRGFWAQLAFTVLVAAFLIVPVVMSITAGVTANFFHGVKSGLTTRWIGEVWRLYRDTIVLSMTIYTEFTLRANFATAAVLSIVLGAMTWVVLGVARTAAGSSAAAAA